jgi:hypothetical protein
VLFKSDLSDIVSISINGQKFIPEKEVLSTEYDDCTGAIKNAVYLLHCGELFTLKVDYTYTYWTGNDSCIITWQPVENDNNTYSIEIEHLEEQYVEKYYKVIRLVYRASGISYASFSVFKAGTTEIIEKKMDSKYLPDIVVQYEDDSKTAIILKSSTEGSSKQFRLEVNDNGDLTVTEM